ncbi:hypothetical protein [Spirosoma sp. 48-14]|nr:hypothetical protein [Spirosoma sp. 48-14]
MTNQDRIDEAQRLMATGKHQDRKAAHQLLKQVRKEEKKTATNQQRKLF